MQTPHLKEIISSLPETPGIYKYFDIDGTLIYIGKAKSLKKRISSYFNKNHHENLKRTIPIL
jgi:excinuclease ABC subunit C